MQSTLKCHRPVEVEFVQCCAPMSLPTCALQYFCIWNLEELILFLSS